MQTSQRKEDVTHWWAPIDYHASHPTHPRQQRLSAVADSHGAVVERDQRPERIVDAVYALTGGTDPAYACEAGSRHHELGL